MKFSFAILLFMALSIFPWTSAAFPPPKISTVANNGMPRDIVPRRSEWNFGPGSLWTHKGWQYATYWDKDRQVSVARRQLPTGKWSVVSLPGYRRTESGDRGKGGSISKGFGDGHEKVALGISPDGVIHLSFDHHLSTLRYRTSLQPIANDPKSYPWDAKLFGPVQDNLGGPRLTSVTYPSFHTDGKHFLCHMRLGGGSGSANSHLFSYEDGKWTINSELESQIIDKNWSGGDGTVNAYPFGFIFHNNRLHLTWCWRDNPDSKSSHDLCYAYSDDYGSTWKNNHGTTIGERGKKIITADSPGLTVWKIAPGRRYRNGGSMTVDSEGRVHVLARGRDGKPYHYRRCHKSSEWSQDQAPRFGSFLTSNQPTQTIFSEGHLYSLKPSKNWNWTLLSDTPEAFSEDSKPGRDQFRFAHDGWVSIIGQQGLKVRSIDFPLMPSK